MCKRQAVELSILPGLEFLKKARLNDGLGHRPLVSRPSSSSSVDSITDDVLAVVLGISLSESISPSAFANLSLVSKRFHGVSRSPQALASISLEGLCCSAASLNSSYCAFLKVCLRHNNMNACYLLGMIEFYVLGNRKDGIKLLVRAARTGNADALYALAVIHFNGSGGSSGDRKIAMGVVLCASAAQQGHVDALWELGYCLQDGYGIKRNESEGKKLHLEASLRERLVASSPSSSFLRSQNNGLSADKGALHFHAPAVLRKLHACSTSSLDSSTSASTGASSPDHGSVQSETLSPSNHEAPTGSRLPAPCSPHSNNPSSCQNVPPMSPHPCGLSPPTFGFPHPTPAAPPAVATPGPTNRVDSASSILRTLCSCLAPLLSQVPVEHLPAIPGPVSRFFLDWFALHPQNLSEEGLKMCGNAGCGRPETRAHEFRCCSECSGPSYCSRTCQSVDWRAGGHMWVCKSPDAEPAA